MIQIIIIFAIMQLGFNLLFKPKYNQMSCGLFGAAADDVSKININKLKILGIYNDSRGGHSCGMSIDGDIIIGTYKNKLFKDFISDYDIQSPDSLPVVLGHTRMATGGTHNEENAHPFGFGSNGDYFSFIGTHNGTLHNEDELAEEYGINTKASVYKNNVMTTRFKIDSEILLEIIYETGFNVLEKYDGAAALAMYNTKKPKTIYLYHGASQKTMYNKEIVEERPLFYYQESENVMYYSSLKNSLEAINDNNGEIGEFEHNVVYEIKNGNISKAKKHIINRSTAKQINSSCSYTPIDYDKKQWCSETKKWIDKVIIPEYSKKLETDYLPATTSKNNNILTFHHKEYEKIMTDFHKDRVYYENLRFYMNKQLMHGVYVLNKEHNLVKVCQYNSLFDTMYQQLNIKENLLYDNPIKLYFIEGIRMISVTDYNQLQQDYKKFTTEQLSYCSVYPIRDISKEDSLCYFKGSLASLSFSTLVGKDIIKINNGVCKEINKKPDNFKYETYYLKEDLDLLKEIDNLKKQIIESNESKNDDGVMVDLYKENILATIEYCTEDCDVSLSGNFVQNQIKSKLEKITKFVTDLLTI